MIEFTFHVAFTLKHDEGVAAATTFLIADYSHPLDASKAFKFTAEVVLSCVFVLKKIRQAEVSVELVRHTKRAIKSVL